MGMNDLPPHEWKSEREKPREPFFGPGAPEALAYAAAWTVTFLAAQWVLH